MKQCELNATNRDVRQLGSYILPDLNTLLSSIPNSELTIRRSKDRKSADEAWEVVITSSNDQVIVARGDSPKAAMGTLDYNLMKLRPELLGKH